MGYRRSIIVRIIAIVLLVALLPWQQVSIAAATVKTKSTGKEVQYEEPKVTTELGNFTDSLNLYIEKLRTSLDNNDLGQFKTDLKATKDLLIEIKKNVSNELSENEERLDDLNASAAMKRHKNIATSIQKQLEAFEVSLDELTKLLDTAKSTDANSMKALSSKLTEIETQLYSEQPEQTLGSSLPTDNVSKKPTEPATGNGINASYMSSSKDAATSPLSTEPVEEDLAVTVETEQTKEIKELADKLNTPVNMYEYVRNNINYEAYYGSRKGAAGTLSQMAGNDYDQAALLMAMLRYKGIPARYVKGTIQVSIDKAMSWTGTSTPEAAVNTLGALGTPTVSMVSGGTIVAVQTEHVWVEAYVPYSINNRIGTGKGNKIWIPLDPSYKQYKIQEGLDFKEITGVSEEDI